MIPNHLIEQGLGLNTYDTWEPNIENVSFTDYGAFPDTPALANFDLKDISISQENLEIAVDPSKGLTPEELERLEDQDIINRVIQDSKANGTTPIGTASLSQLQRYNDPVLGFSPNRDNEEIYAKAHPASMSKAVQKAYATGTATMFYGITDTMGDLKDMVAGNWDNIRGSDRAREMADVFMKAELDNPIFYSKDDSEFKKFGYDALAASGSMVGSLVDGIASSVLISVGGSLVTAGTGSAVATGLGITKLAKSIKSGLTGFKHASRIMKQTADKVAGLQKAGKVLNQYKNFNTLSRTALATHLSVSGEAALQAELNKQKFLEEAQNEYYKKNGEFATGEDLKNINSNADSLRTSTYRQNWALVGASTLVQIPGILSGKVTNKLSKNKYFDIVTEGGKVVAKPKRLGLEYTKEVLKDALAEGSEEYFQTVIDDATTSYFKDKLDTASTVNTADYIAKFGKSAADRFTFKEGGALREALIGAVLGGTMSVFTNAPQLATYDSKTVAGFNKRSNEVFSFLKTENALNQSLEEATPEEAEQILTDKVVNIAKESYGAGTSENRREYIEQFKNISAEEFGATLGLTGITEEIKEEVIEDMLTTFDRTISIKESIDSVYTINPIDIESSWFKKAVATLGQDLVGKEVVYANHLFNQLKDIYTDTLIKKTTLDTEIDTLKDNLQNAFFTTVEGTVTPIVDSRLNLLFEPDNLKDNLSNFIANLGVLPDSIDLVGNIKNSSDLQLKKKLDNLESNNLYEKLNTILGHYGVTEETVENLGQFYKLYNTRKIFQRELADFENPIKQVGKLQEVAEFFSHVLTKHGETKSTETVVETPTGAEVVNEDGTTETFDTKEEAEKAVEIKKLEKTDKETSEIPTELTFETPEQTEERASTEGIADISLDGLAALREEIVGKQPKEQTFDEKEEESRISELQDSIRTDEVEGLDIKTPGFLNGNQFFNVQDRRAVFVEVFPGFVLPFYQSSEGTAGKKAGGWYPFTGTNGKGYINKFQLKGSKYDVANYHSSDLLRQIGEKLNKELGTTFLSLHTNPDSSIVSYDKNKKAFDNYLTDAITNFKGKTSNDLYDRLATLLKKSKETGSTVDSLLTAAFSTKSEGTPEVTAPPLSEIEQLRAEAAQQQSLGNYLKEKGATSSEIQLIGKSLQSLIKMSPNMSDFFKSGGNHLDIAIPGSDEIVKVEFTSTAKDFLTKLKAVEKKILNQGSKNIIKEFKDSKKKKSTENAEAVNTALQVANLNTFLKQIGQEGNKELKAKLLSRIKQGKIDIIC